MARNRIYKEIIIDAQVKKVWSIFSELEKWLELSKYVVKAYWNTSKKWTLDSSFTQIIVNIIPFKKNRFECYFDDFLNGLKRKVEK